MRVAVSDSPAGSVFASRFRLQREVGRSATTSVWLALDESSGEPVALKFLARSLVRSDSDVAALRDAIAHVQPAEHPCLSLPREVVSIDGHIAVVAPFVDGSSLLQARMARPSRCFEVDDIAPLVCAWCEAMEAAHAKRVVHGALKPTNLFRDASGRLHVTDFGLGAWITTMLLRQNGRGLAAERSAWLSPTQVRGADPLLSDDVFAFGAIVYELLAGTPPFPAERRRLRVGGAHMPASMTERRTQNRIAGAPIPMAWEQTVAACLDREGYMRPAGFRKILDRLASTLPAPARVLAAETTPAADPAPAPVPAPLPPEPAPTPPPPVPVPTPTARTSSPDRPPTLPRSDRRPPLRVPRAAAIPSPPASPFGDESRENERGWMTGSLRFFRVLVVLALLGIGGWYAWYVTAGQRAFEEISSAITDFPEDGGANQIAVMDTLIASPPETVNRRQRRELRIAWENRKSRLLPTHPPAESIAAPAGSVHVRTHPAGAQVQFADQPPVAAPLELATLPPGTYRVRARLEGYTPVEREIEVRRGETTEVAVRLERVTGGLHLVSSPDGAMFEVIEPESGELVRRGYTPTQLRLPTGHYRVRFTQDGNAARETEVQVTARDDNRAHVEFPEDTLVAEVPADSAPKKSDAAAPESLVPPDEAPPTDDDTAPLAQSPPAPIPTPAQPEPVAPPEPNPVPVVAEEKTTPAPSSAPAPEAPGETPTPINAPIPSFATPRIADTTVRATPMPAAPPADEPIVAPAPTESAAPPPADNEGIFELGNVTVPPRLLARADPELPWRLRRLRDVERVELLVVIDRTGRVSSAAVLSATNENLGEHSLRAVWTWRFHPAEKDGQPVAVRVVVPLAFRPAR